MHNKKHAAALKKMAQLGKAGSGVAVIGPVQTLPPPVMFQDPLALTPTNIQGPLAGLPGPGVPAGSLGFTVPAGVTDLARGLVGAGGCELLPEGFARDACLAAAGIFTGGGGPPALPALPGGGGAVASAGIGSAPTLEAVSRFRCPDFLNGMGILWIDFTGAVTCLPRGVSGTAFGLVRKNPKRPKPFISHAEHKALKAVNRSKKKAKQFAKLAGLHTHSAHRPR